MQRTREPKSRFRLSTSSDPNRLRACGWLVGWLRLALVCAFLCAFVSAFVCSFRCLFACVLGSQG